MKSYSLDNCLRVYKNLVIIDDCFKSKSPSLAAIKREKGESFTEGFMAAWLINLNEILNLNKPMSELQIILCVSEILNNYSSLKIADLTLLFKRIMSGEFGEFYESISIPKVLTFFKLYNEERMNRAYEINSVKHQEYKSGDPMNISKNIKRIWKGTQSY
ncbi:hypothetical protein [Tenacibaculum maritimum]|uniref:hypothetical protein n=1 Tax=Tenacibaculum maritimum TaxID=107401 RepID=UPI0012E41DD8|nr:hypothetical protein [Tenacibaculum maritimum]CAA0193344.1 conserved hypothetical protein [Tenacibaculum maritimum]